ncbi:MAG: recombination protein RecR [Synergistaceae bacterium]|nr:recombination protein RecR [Synergistaceae bacterium]
MDPISELVSAFKNFPGLGSKSARRAVFYLLKQDEDELKRLGTLIATLKNNLKTCSECGNLTYDDPCPICSDPFRDRRVLCVVEDIESLTAFEAARIYNGLYHVLGTRASPLEGKDITNEDAKFLLSHIKKVNPAEVILATSPNIEGDLTRYSLLDILKGLKKVKITRLAYGLPLGGSIEFADKLTLHTSLEARRPVS